MTVMVIGASGLIGRALVPLLVRKDEVRACVRRPEAAVPLRTMGAKVAVGGFDDADALAEILKRVYTVVHLVGGPNQRGRRRRAGGEPRLGRHGARRIA